MNISFDKKNHLYDSNYNIKWTGRSYNNEKKLSLIMITKRL